MLDPVKKSSEADAGRAGGGGERPDHGGGGVGVGIRLEEGLGALEVT